MNPTDFARSLREGALEAARAEFGPRFRRDVNVTVLPGRIIAEFTNAEEAKDFVKLMELQGKQYTVTGGINHPFAVRPLVIPHPSASQSEPMERV